METKSIVGLFKKNEHYLELARKLSSAGFVRDDVMIEDDKNDVFMLSVSLKDNDVLEKARTIFQEFEPYKIYEFPFVAENAKRIREYVAASARTQIYSTPGIRTRGHQTDGINSEVVVGKQ